ncbi:PQQ-dependent sugar dehydrogenase [Jatrophihabitans sp. YIM 134969]
MVASRFRRRAAVLTAAAGAVALVGGCTTSADTPASPSASTTTPTASPSASGSSSSAAGTEAPARAGTPTVVAAGLEVPWGVAFLPGGDALVSERDSHRIVRVTPSGGTTPVGTVPGVGGGGEGGLLGLALSPDFATDQQVFAYLTTDTDNRVVRFTYDGRSMSGFTPIRTGIPAAGNHNGGRIAFGPDGLLYVTAGDANARDRAPDPAYLGGKVLRMTADGRPAPGNPDPASVVFTLGHRNPQGLAFGPDGELWEAEFGQNSLDEINLLEAGNDYGWPAAEGTEGDTGDSTAPLVTFATSDASPSGLAYAGGALWLAALGGERLYRIAVNADGSLAQPETLFEGRFGRLRTVTLAPDGALWVTTSNRDGRGDPEAEDDRILRIPLTT